MTPAALDVMRLDHLVDSFAEIQHLSRLATGVDVVLQCHRPKKDALLGQGGVDVVRIPDPDTIYISERYTCLGRIHPLGMFRAVFSSII